jgi:hypothetical protein
MDKWVQRYQVSKESNCNGRARFGADTFLRIAVVRGRQCEGLAGILFFVLRKNCEFVITIIIK